VLFWNVKLPFSDTAFFNDSIFKKNIAPGNAGSVTINVSHVPNGNYKVVTYQVGYHHNDAFSKYLEMGSPSNISLQQEATLKKLASGNPVSEKKILITDGKYKDHFKINENDIYFIKLEKI
jgi:xylan 1,4-beta-xylosidase